MKPDERNIDEVLKRYLPSASKEETETDGERVLHQLRSRADAPVKQRIVDPDPVSSFGWRRIAMSGADASPARSASPIGRSHKVMVAAAAAVVLAVFVGTTIVRRQGGASAVVETVDGGLYRVVEGKAQAIQAGESLKRGESVRTNGGAGSTLALADGSLVEMRSKSELALQTADDGVLLQLNGGSIIVTAAKQRNGHLYVRTKDVTVSVVGTVFLVNAEETGSRVAVIQGEVRVQQGATAKKLLSGEQVATDPIMQPVPVIEEISWSRNAPAHLALLQQSLALLQQAVIIPTTTLSQNPAEPQVAFEVASVKLRRTSAGGGRGGGGGQEPKCYGSIQIDPRRFAITNMMLYRIITLAYGKSCYGFEKMDLLSGGPGWTTSDRFDIEAVIPEGSPSYTKQQFDPDARQAGEGLETPKLQAMLQHLLAERFKLVVRREMREVPGYVLSVARGGPKLTPWKEGEPATLGAVTGGLNQNGEWRSIVRGARLSIAQLSNQLVFVTARPVLDRTGITGDFNYNIEFTPLTPPDPAITGNAPLVSGPSLFTALEERLGLKLEATKTPVEFLVIDHVERPSEN